jgi:hypothetical protein
LFNILLRQNNPDVFKLTVNEYISIRVRMSATTSVTVKK